MVVVVDQHGPRWTNIRADKEMRLHWGGKKSTTVTGQPQPGCSSELQKVSKGFRFDSVENLSSFSLHFLTCLLLNHIESCLATKITGVTF